MANNYSAQGSITIKRLRNGDSLFLTFNNNGIPLYQGVDPNTGGVTPDWTVAANQPEIIPVANSVRGNAVTLGSHQWYYNNNSVPLTFNGAISGDWQADSTGKFAIRISGSNVGSLKIIANLASITNIASDSLTYKAVASVGGVEYNVEKSIDILIQYIGASSYVGFVMAGTEQLTSLVTSSTLTTKLECSGKNVTNYYVKWYKDTVEWAEKAGLKEITVTRNDVDGTQLFIAEFYENSGDTDYVCRAGIRIIDTLDDFKVDCYISSTNKEVDTGSPVTVGARIINMRTGAEVTPTSPIWAMYIMKKSDWSVLKSSSTNSIQVTTTETDAGGQENDVEVTAEVSWSDSLSDSSSE
jgi:hypothetical protein